MKKFTEYYKDRLLESWMGDIADRFITQTADFLLNQKRPGKSPLSRERSIGNAPRSPTGRFPMPAPAPIPPRPEDPSDLSQLGADVDPRKALDYSPLDDNNLKKMVYDKIKEFVQTRRAEIRDAQDIYAMLKQDPEIDSYLSRVSGSQKGAYTRNINSMMSQQPKAPLKVYNPPPNQVVPGQKYH